MTIRGDITVNFNLSPRLITVAAPSAALTIQDLVDTLRSIEAEQVNVGYPYLLDASGKTPLGGGAFVGITATLQDAQVAFEARGGPTYTPCVVSGGNLVAVDANQDTINPIFPTAFTQVTLAQSSSPTLITAGGSIPTAVEIAAQVRIELTPELTYLMTLQNGLTSVQATMLLEIYRLYGLDPTRPLVVTTGDRTAGAEITQSINTAGSTTTVTRLP